MIGFLEGSILHHEIDNILLRVGDIGYEVLLNPQILEKILIKENKDETISLYIYYHQTERQPKPVLIGFESLEEKEFFQTFITVDAIGPMKAIKAMTRPTNEIALAIEKKDVSFLKGLTGIGKRTAEKIIATLNGKVEKFVGIINDEIPVQTTENAAMTDIGHQVEEVLISQLGHSPTSARRMIKEAYERNANIASAEALFDEIYQENN